MYVYEKKDKMHVAQFLEEVHKMEQAKYNARRNPLVKKIVNDDDIVTSGDGLYSRGGAYYFRGEYVNNYVKMDNSLWRIVKVTSDDNVVLPFIEFKKVFSALLLR